jgi:hypothetical protein
MERTESLNIKSNCAHNLRRGSHPQILSLFLAKPTVTISNRGAATY